MTETILSAVISASAAILVCILTSVFQNRKTRAQQEKTISLIEYKIGELTSHVEKHNNYIERTLILEGQMKEVQHDIRDLKGVIKIVEPSCMRTTCDRTNPPFHFMKEKVKFSALIKKDVEKIMEEANFTDEQMKIFSCLLKDKYTDVGIMEITKIPHKRYYEVKKIISEKIIRVMNK